MSKENEKHVAWPILKRLYGFIRPYKFWLILSAVATLVIAMADIVWAYLIRNLVSNAIDGITSSIFFSVVCFLVVLVIGIAAKYFCEYAAGRFTAFTMRDIRKKLVENMEKISVASLEKDHSGTIISKMTNDASTLQDISSAFTGFICVPASIIIGTAFLLYTNWKLYLVSMCTLPVTMYLCSRLSKPISKDTNKSLEHLGEVNSIVQDTVGGIDILKSFNLEEPLNKKCRSALNSSYKFDLKVVKRVALMDPFEVILEELPFVLCIIFGGYLAYNNKMGVPDLVFFLRLMRNMVFFTVAFPRMISRFMVLSGAAGRLFDIMDIPCERSDGNSITDEGKPSESDETVIEFKNVVFGYNESTIILDKTSFEVGKGKTIALVGPSGCGKSTVISLICGFYSSYEGEIRLYGKDIKTWAWKSVRENISLISQDTYLFPGTIGENISYGKAGATKDEIAHAAKIANAHEFISELPEGYETMVGERGVRLSGGQKQRISIARAVLKNAPILLMDEPTSALDTDSEALVKEALDRFMTNRTVIVIAHRLSTIRDAEQVFVMDSGRITESGTHEELMKRSGLYTQLYLKQFVSNNLDAADVLGEDLAG